MTTIAYRDGVIAADTGCTRGPTVLCGVRKVARAPDGTLVGASGDATFMGAMVAWAEAGMKETQPEAEKDDDGADIAIIVRPSGAVEMHEPGGMFVIDAPYVAVGCGRSVALGAMFTGADAEHAVRASIAHDAWTNGDVTVLRR